MLRSSLYVSAFSLLVQFIGFVKLLLIANYFGVSPQLDGYYLALVIPGLFLGFIGGALQTGFMPVYGKLLTDSEFRKAAEFRSSILWLSVIALIILCLVLTFLAETLMHLLVPEASNTIEEFAIYSFRILVFSLLLNALADYLALVLNAHHRFYSAAAAPLVNVIISTAILYIWPKWQLDNLIWGLIAGLFAQVLIIAIVLLKNNIHFEFKIAYDSPELQKAWKLMVPILVGVALANANISIDQIMAALAGDGGVSTLGYASRFHNVVTQAGVMGVSIVLLPTLISLVGLNKTDELFELLTKILKWALLLSILVLSSIFLFGEGFLGYFMVRGEFTSSDVSRVYGVWFWYSLGLFPMSAGIFYSKLFIAWEMPIVLTKFALVSFLLNIVFNLLLIDPFGVSGIAMATTLVYFIAAFLFYFKSKSHRSIINNGMISGQ
jgi:putative peptidoglycan lipid II flippase